MKYAIIFFLSITFLSGNVHAKTFEVKSPDGKIRIAIDADKKISYSVYFGNIPVLEPSALSLTIRSHGVLGIDPKVLSHEIKTVDDLVLPVVAVKSSTIEDKYNELVLSFKGNYSVAFRAYNDGVAYRFITDLDDDIVVESEKITYHFKGDPRVVLARANDFITHQESIFTEMKLSETEDTALYFPPSLVKIENGPFVLITESDLYDYPGTYFTKGEGRSLEGVQPHFVLKEKQISDRTVIAETRADYIAETKGSRSFPWRVMCIAEKDGDLLLNQLVYLLARPLELEDTDWIKPGNVAWDWWNANNITGVDFKSGINTETYMHYIDFAAEYGLDYIILDEGWCNPADHFEVAPGIDLEKICSYGKEKGIGIILWVVWKTLDDQLEESLEWFEELGVKGIKVDFMQRDDQWMVNYYLKIAQQAAAHHMLVDFHGAYKPSGLRRAWPNVITREGIMGMEHSKWSANVTPEHDVTAPFIRMVAGPMDYTPGAMDNAHEKNFLARFERPMSLGTRCHQLAMYVIFESPLQMLSDNPQNYRREHECTRFISQVPTVWDETVVLDAKVGEYILLARRSGENWYIGAMSDNGSRELEIDFSFLPDGEYNLELFRDGVNAVRNAQDYKRIDTRVTSSDRLIIHMAPGGGWAGRVY